MNAKSLESELECRYLACYCRGLTVDYCDFRRWVVVEIMAVFVKTQLS